MRFYIGVGKSWRVPTWSVLVGLSAVLWLGFFKAFPSHAATTLSESPSAGELYVTSDETYAYLFDADTDTTTITSNTTPTNFPTTPADTCAAYGDGNYRVVSVNSYAVCNTAIRTDCEADTGATTADFSCTGGVLSIGGGGPVCGDGTLESPEECDDGDTDNGDGCDSVCAVETGWTCDAGSPTACTEDTVNAESEDIIANAPLIWLGSAAMGLVLGLVLLIGRKLTALINRK